MAKYRIVKYVDRSGDTRYAPQGKYWLTGWHYYHGIYDGRWSFKTYDEAVKSLEKIRNPYREVLNEIIYL
jgi:hypothetical protein